MRQVQTLFCDDIRQEVGGKLTYVGAYAGSMLVSQFPAVLPKFCIAVTVVLDAIEPDSEVVLRVLSDDAVLAERAVESGVLADLRKALQTSGDGLAPDRVQLINSFFVFSPFEIAGPCALRVRVLVGTEELRGVGLRIEEMPATD